ncbi:PLP-dependent transferase [Meira miltonrushii]|uniref:PLP-dependent transferase n=1 Tax=Meira miltonrushii TaxID=1280837 RepID=A0A316VGU0_9BASI|nr:PLP-dependent transferase [Meira miltonrushii]PWN36812.1 PLP-dependent transferase [Meira miltonrushii]
MMTDNDRASTSYGHQIERIRESQLPHWRGSLHLDATASAPVPRCVLNAVHANQLESTPPSNPHSNSPSGRKTRQEIDNVRKLICNEFFGVQRKAGIITDGKGQDAGWEVVFNSGTTAGLQLIARSFDFGKYGRFAYLDQSHSSLYGLRDIVQVERQSGAYGVDALREEEVLDWVRDSASSTGQSLLALPLQCNATGKRYHRLLSRILKTRDGIEQKTGERKVFILLDAASYLSPSSRMKLREDDNHEVDFICFSFIKILGYPSGLGATLIQRASAFALTGKSYYGGGTLEASTSRMQWRQPMRELHESLEDGTLNIHGILAVPPALSAIRSEGVLGCWEKASEYVDHLTGYLWNSLKSLKHADGSPICEIYSAEPEEWKECNMLSQGPCILFNVLRAQGTHKDKTLSEYRIDPSEVDRLACLDDIHIRSGRMCNVGAITASLGIKEDDVVALWNQGIGCGNIQHSNNASTLRTDDPCEYARLAALVNGAIRVSISAYNTTADIDKFVAFLEKYFYCGEIEDEEDLFVECQGSVDIDDNKSDIAFTDDNSDESHPQSKTSSCQTSIYDNANDCLLQKMFICPIKSCAAQEITGPWKVTDTGLSYDRDFCIVDLSNGKVLSQKRVTSMARIRPQVCIERGTLEIGFYAEDGKELQKSLTVPLTITDTDPSLSDSTNGERQFDMCGTSLHPRLIMDEDVRLAFSDFLGLDCTLARSPLSHRSADGIPIKLSNESPFLMITTESVAQICQWMKEDGKAEVDFDKVASAFRANFIISQQESGEEGFYEDAMTKIRIGQHQFTVIGPCRRCEMIALDPLTGNKTPQVMSAVAKHRRCKESGPYKSKLLFGQHLIRHSATISTVSDLIKPGMRVVAEAN